MIDESLQCSQEAVTIPYKIVTLRFLDGATFQSEHITDVLLGLSYHEGCCPVFHFAASQRAADGRWTLKLRPSLFVARYDVFPFSGSMGEEYPQGSIAIQKSLISGDHQSVTVIGSSFLRSGPPLRVMSQLPSQASRKPWPACGRAYGFRRQAEGANRELRQANEILRKASAYFAQAELDRRFKP